MGGLYNEAWVAAQVAETIDVWKQSAADRLVEGPRYSERDHESREIAYDAELGAVEGEARRAPRSVVARKAAQERLTASFAQFAANALDLEPETTSLLTNCFLPSGIEFSRYAHQFDPTLSREDTIQACRNAWTACGLQPLLGMPSRMTPSIVAYSLLYPYSDNYLDAGDVPVEAKLSFSRRFRNRLRGEGFKELNAREAAIWALVEMVESEYPRAEFPDVFDCMLAIHQAQEDSLAQLRGGTEPSDAELLQISFAKGGTSVLADACLARGWMTAAESRFAFEWGALLQLGDDLQDVREDLRRGSATLFTRAARRGEALDTSVTQLLNFCERVAAGMDCATPGNRRMKDLLKMSWRSLIIGAVADASEFFTPAFQLKMEGSSPFRFEFLRARRKRLASRQGLYAVLFDLFVEAGEDEGRLPMRQAARESLTTVPMG
jgi:hypothetical protein